jgi:S-DNA-T family DNA segregation ATPase FtsK/SpoIIIE
MIGPVGQRLAEIMLAMAGVAAYLWTFLLGGLAIGLFRGHSFQYPPRRVITGIGCLVTLSVLIHLLVSPTRLQGFPPGGGIAAWVGEISRALFHDAGSLIIHVTAFLVLLVFTLNRSLTVMLRGLTHSIRELREAWAERNNGEEDDGEDVAEGDIQHPVPIDAPRMQSDLIARKNTSEESGCETIAGRNKTSPGTGVRKTGKRRLTDRLRAFFFRKGKAQDDLLIEPEGGSSTDKPELKSDFFRMKDETMEHRLEGSDHKGADLDQDVAQNPSDTVIKAAPESFVEVPPLPDAPTDEDLTDAISDEPPPIQAPPKKAKAPKKPQVIVEAEAMKRIPEDPVVATDQPLPLEKAEYQAPALSLLDFQAPKGRNIDEDVLQNNARILVQKLADFKVECEVDRIRPGPVVTMYEVRPARGVKINKIANLGDDLAMALQAEQIRIVAPIPGRDVVGIEIPNRGREIVYLKEIIGADDFRSKKRKLPLAIGKDIYGQPMISDLAKMPHLLVAGATGAGKSVGINTFIVSLLYRHTPDEVRMIMVDPKMLELSIYDGIPHLLLPVITNPKKANLALRWAVREMERRYSLLKPVGVRNIEGYNRNIEKLQKKSRSKKGEEAPKKLPYLVVIIDELADLMMVAGKDVEMSIARLAQMARAAGIHLIVATQRPDAKVITGLIKANFPTRMSFKVSSKIDSRIILDTMGAERLLGMGDMLLVPPGMSHLVRCHGAYVSDEEVAGVVAFVKSQRQTQYDTALMEAMEREEEEANAGADPSSGDGDFDPLYDEAVGVIARSQRATISYLQRELGVGYNRSSRIMEQLQREAVVGPQVGTKPREIFVQPL